MKLYDYLWVLQWQDSRGQWHCLTRDGGAGLDIEVHNTRADARRAKYNCNHSPLRIARYELAGLETCR